MLVAVAACTKEPAKPAPLALEGWPARLATLEAKHLGTGDDVRLAALITKDRPTLFAFWATYCPPCIDEIPMFEKLHAEGHHIVGVSMDAGDEAYLRETLEKYGPSYPQVLLDEPSMKAAGLVLTEGLPFSLVVDAEGAVVAEHSGKMTRDAALAALARPR